MNNLTGARSHSQTVDTIQKNRNFTTKTSFRALVPLSIKQEVLFSIMLGKSENNTI